VDLKKKRKRKKGKNIVKVYVCDCILFMNVFFYDEIAKNKEEFNILICSWLKIMNLHVNRIYNNR
jgi:hypothetical protein